GVAFGHPDPSGQHRVRGRRRRRCGSRARGKALPTHPWHADRTVGSDHRTTTKPRGSAGGRLLHTVVPRGFVDLRRNPELGAQESFPHLAQLSSIGSYAWRECAPEAHCSTRRRTPTRPAAMRQRGALLWVTSPRAP